MALMWSKSDRPGPASLVDATPRPLEVAGGRTIAAPFARGRAFASFGEIVQGRLSSGQDFLVTLPVDLWSTCRAHCEPVSGASLVTCELPKSTAAARGFLAVAGLHAGVHVRLDLSRTMPVGKGLSSSTADMLAVLRALERAFDLELDAREVSRIFAAIEPHDALHYPSSVMYDHRQGRLLHRLEHIPAFRIVGVDTGGELSTLEYNRRLRYTAGCLAAYDRLRDDLLAAFAARDDESIARCARRSAELHAARNASAFLAAALRRSHEVGALGLLATHSGTCSGFLLPADAPDREVSRVEAAVADLGRVFTTRTLRPHDVAELLPGPAHD
jgi:uncharacterized protein involved in propanediol utilization